MEKMDYFAKDDPKEAIGKYAHKIENRLLIRLLGCVDKDGWKEREVSVHISERHNGNFASKYTRRLAIEDILVMLPQEKYNFFKLED